LAVALNSTPKADQFRQLELTSPVTWVNLVATRLVVERLAGKLQELEDFIHIAASGRERLANLLRFELLDLLGESAGALRDNGIAPVSEAENRPLGEMRQLADIARPVVTVKRSPD
jgi:hypothetical protein